MDGFWIAFDIQDGLLELDAYGVDGFESVVPEDFLADFIPESFLRVELRRIEPALAKAGGEGSRTALQRASIGSPFLQTSSVQRIHRYANAAIPDEAARAIEDGLATDAIVL